MSQKKVILLSITPNAEDLIEDAGRTCYQSFDKKGPGSKERFIKMLIKNGHLSVLEHASATFRLGGCSRAMTHQLVRHRLASYSQRSQRYVNEYQFDYAVPPSIIRHGKAERFREMMATIQSWYQELRDAGIPKEDARFVLPNACTTEIVVSANFREWRHIFSQRCTPQAQWEIRWFACEMLRILNLHAPATFADQYQEFVLEG
jgi:thymidylate synthase (FAD)